MLYIQYLLLANAIAVGMMALFWSNQGKLNLSFKIVFALLAIMDIIRYLHI